MSSNTPDQSRLNGRAIADLLGLLFVLGGLAGFLYSLFQFNEWAGWAAVSLLVVSIGLGLGTDARSS